MDNIATCDPKECVLKQENRVFARLLLQVVKQETAKFGLTCIEKCHVAA
jgi:hypothetical protein